MDSVASLDRVLELGEQATNTQGLKLHPLHIVKGTQLARQWKKGIWSGVPFDDYVEAAVEIIRRTPPEITFHRLTGTAERSILLAPQWCARKWDVLNAIALGLEGKDWQRVNDVKSELELQEEMRIPVLQYA